MSQAKDYDALIEKISEAKSMRSQAAQRCQMKFAALTSFDPLRISLFGIASRVICPKKLNGRIVFARSIRA